MWLYRLPIQRLRPGIAKLYRFSLQRLGGESPLQRILPLSTYIISCFSKNTTLTAMPIECAIIERYSVLYNLMFETEYVQKDVDDDVIVSDREDEYTDFLIGKKFSANFDLDEEYQNYLNHKVS